jgi:hypothetical protein
MGTYFLSAKSYGCPIYFGREFNTYNSFSKSSSLLLNIFLVAERGFRNFRYTVVAEGHGAG